MNDPTPNLPLLRKMVDHITAHPEESDNKTWGVKNPCGTAFCAATHAATLSGMEPVWLRAGNAMFMDSVRDADGNVEYVGDVAQRLLGLNDQERFDLFRAQNTRADIQTVAERIAARGGERL